MGILEEIAEGREKRRKELECLGPEFLKIREKFSEKAMNFISHDVLGEGEELMTHSTSLLYDEKDLPEPPFKLKKKY
jgi:hypothetical protein